MKNSSFADVLWVRSRRFLWAFLVFSLTSLSWAKKGDADGPAAPGPLPFSQVTQTQLRANWTDGGNPPLTFYEAILSVAPSPSTNGLPGNQVQVVSGSFAVFSSLNPGTPYFVDVRATNPLLGASSYTSLGSTTTAPAFLPPPVAPGPAPVSGITSNQLQANWTAGGNVPGTFYDTVLSLAPSPSANGLPGNQAATTTDLFHIFPALTANTLYYADVRARTAAGISPITDLGSAVTSANPPVAAPPSNIQSTQASANWGAGGNPAGTIYNVQISADPSFVPLAGSAQTVALTNTFTGLLPGTNYVMQVQAINSAGIPTAFVPLPSITTPPAGLSGPALTGTALSDVSINWTWSGVANAAGYRLLNAEGASLFGDLPANTVSFKESGLAANTAYTRILQAFNGGIIAQSNPVTRFTLASPPTHLQAAEIGISSITFSWDANGNPPATAYRLDYWTLGHATATLTVNDLRTTLSNLPGGTTFFIEVRSLNGDGVLSAIGSPADSASPHVLQIVTAGAQVAVVVSGAKVYPNPFRPSLGDTLITFANLPAGTHIKIYTLAGEKVKDLDADASGTVQWDAKNQSGQAVGSGVYFALVEGGGDKRRLKVAIQR